MADIVSYANVSITQTGNDTFTQGTITTGLQNLNQAWSIREIIAEWGSTTAVGFNAAILSSSSMVGFAIAVKSVAALPLATDKSTLFAHKKSGAQLTAVGWGMSDKIWRWQFDSSSAPLWVADPFYIQNMSAATGVPMVLNLRLGYVVTNVNAAVKAGLLLSALQS